MRFILPEQRGSFEIPDKWWIDTPKSRNDRKTFTGSEEAAQRPSQSTQSADPAPFDFFTSCFAGMTINPLIFFGGPGVNAGLTALRAVCREIQLVGHPGQVRQRSRLHLSHDLAAMDFYGDLADADVVGDLLVEAAGHHQGHHLPLAGS